MESVAMITTGNNSKTFTLVKDVRRHNLLLFILLVFGVMIMFLDQKLVLVLPPLDNKSCDISSITNNVTELLPIFASPLVKEEEQSDSLPRQQVAAATTIIIAAPPISPTTPEPRVKRWAVMMMGGARTYAFTRQSFLENIVKQTDSQVDIFTYSFFRQELSKNDLTNLTNNNNNNNPTSSGSCHIDDMSLQLLNVDSAVLHIDNNFVKFKTEDTEAMTHDRLGRQQMEHLEIIESYSKENNVTYDYLLITRPDLYFSLPLDMKQLEQELDDRVNRSDNAVVFNPTCCKFQRMPFGGKGWCDRFTASTYHDFVRMIKGTNDWYKVARHRVFEGAFRDRADYANLTDFDLPAQAYAFFTMRLLHARQHCSGKGFSVSWTDSLCHQKATTGPSKNNYRAQADEYIIQPVPCRLMNHSTCFKK